MYHLQPFMCWNNVTHLTLYRRLAQTNRKGENADSTKVCLRLSSRQTQLTKLIAQLN